MRPVPPDFLKGGSRAASRSSSSALDRHIRAPRGNHRFALRQGHRASAATRSAAAGASPSRSTVRAAIARLGMSSLRAVETVIDASLKRGVSAVKVGASRVWQQNHRTRDRHCALRSVRRPARRAPGQARIGLRRRARDRRLLGFALLLLAANIGSIRRHHRSAQVAVMDRRLDRQFHRLWQSRLVLWPIAGLLLAALLCGWAAATTPGSATVCFDIATPGLPDRRDRLAGVRNVSIVEAADRTRCGLISTDSRIRSSFRRFNTSENCSSAPCHFRNTSMAPCRPAMRRLRSRSR